MNYKKKWKNIKEKGEECITAGSVTYKRNECSDEEWAYAKKVNKEEWKEIKNWLFSCMMWIISFSIIIGVGYIMFNIDKF